MSGRWKQWKEKQGKDFYERRQQVEDTETGYHTYHNFTISKQEWHAKDKKITSTSKLNHHFPAESLQFR